MPCDPTRIDETLQELNTHGTRQFPFEYCRSTYGEGYDRFPWHWHREFEVVLVERGEAHCLLGGQRLVLGQGEGLLIQSGVIHGYETPQCAVMPTVLFMPEFIAPEGSAIYSRFVEPFLQAAFSHAILRPSVAWQRQALDAIMDISHMAASDAPTLPLDQHAAVCRLWSALFVHLQEMQAPGDAGNTLRLQARLRRMIAHIEAHYDHKLSLTEIARAASVSTSEALRCFRDGLHTTPVDYLNRYRLNQARNRLLTTALSVTEIAEESGFSSPAYFDRVFRRAYAASPRDYRRVHRG